MSGDYEAEDIEILEGLEPVRKNPSMYIGGTDGNGLHHLVWELLDNAVDEALAGYAKTILVELFPPLNSVRVCDTGRGIPCDKHPQAGISTLDVVFTKLHAGGKFSGKGYKVSGGLHGVGASVVNALSSRVEVIVWRDGYIWERKYIRGKPQGRIKRSPIDKKDGKKSTLTSVQFTPDPEIFGDQQFDSKRIVERVRTKAYLIPGVEFKVLNLESIEEETFLFSGGLSDFLADTIEEQKLDLTTEFPMVAEAENGEGKIKIALTWTYGVDEQVFSFANGIPTEGGSHVDGLRQGVVRAVKEYWETSGAPKRIKPTPEDIREGMVAIVSVFMEDPHFQGQTKEKLNNAEMRAPVDNLVKHAVYDWLLKNSTQAGQLIERIVQAAKVRTASRQAAEVSRRPSQERLSVLPGKLADCISRDPEETELFLVEGESAGGSAKQGRDRQFQAILPLRGKVLNTEHQTLKKVSDNKELRMVIEALGCSIGKEFKESRLRYHKIILLMDADADGHHIATLLMMFFFRFMPQLIQGGYIYLARPPLYRVEGKKTYWVRTDEELESILKKVKGVPEITRFKGLGELPAKELWETTMNPKRRTLLKVEIPADSFLATEVTMSALMGGDADSRYAMIMSYKDGATLDYEG